MDMIHFLKVSRLAMNFQGSWELIVSCFVSPEANQLDKPCNAWNPSTSCDVTTAEELMCRKSAQGNEEKNLVKGTTLAETYTFFGAVGGYW